MDLETNDLGWNHLQVNCTLGAQELGFQVNIDVSKVKVMFRI